MSEPVRETTGATIVSAQLDNRVYDVIQSLATEYRTTKSMIVRLAIDEGLEKYLGSVRYIDHEQADIINKNIIIVGNLLTDIRMQLLKIGVNINQIAYVRNVMLKQRITYEELKLITEHEPSITKDDINTLVAKMDEVIKEVVDKYDCKNRTF